MIATKIKIRFLLNLVLNTVLLGNLLLAMLLGATPAVVMAQAPAPANTVKTPANTPAPASSGYTPDVYNPNIPYAYSGPQASIERLLCTPTLSDSNSSVGTNDLTNCINKLYRFGAAIGAFALVTILVIAGYLYIVGSEKGKGKAKTLITSAIAGMAIILTAYLFLSFINPTILQFRTITPPVLVNVAPLADCAGVGLPAGCVIGAEGGIDKAGTGARGSLGDDGDCKDCVVLDGTGIPLKAHSYKLYAKPDLRDKLLAMTKMNLPQWHVTAAYAPEDRGHNSPCHLVNGRCADIVALSPTPQNWAAICKAAVSVGLRPYNEVSGDATIVAACGADYSAKESSANGGKRSGANMHMNL